MYESGVSKATVITFSFFRLPKLFLVLCVCIGGATWFGVSVGRHQPPHSMHSIPTINAVPNKALPTMAGLNNDPPIEEASLGQKAPDFTLIDTSGRSHSLSMYSGKPVVLYFWASWCPYCIEGMPSLSLLQDSYQDDDLIVLAINILEEPSKVQGAVRSMNLSYPLLLDDTGHVTRSYLVRAIPSYAFIDRNGVYKDMAVGSARQGVLEAKIESLIEAANKSPEASSN